MNGKKTLIVLGAGASFCYENGTGKMPTQENMIGSLFKRYDASKGFELPSMGGSYGLNHSSALGQYLRKYFQIPEDDKKEYAKLDYWTYIQNKGYTLESLYGELEKNIEKEKKYLLDDFEAIIRMSVTEPINDRSEERVCHYHKKLIENLEPGDCILNFNWDSLASDALLYHSLFWFPNSGFGVYQTYSVSKFKKKQYPLNSYIDLLHIHGSIVIYELVEAPKGTLPPKYIYIGPNSYNSLGCVKHLMENNKKNDISDEESRKIILGFLNINGSWYRPIFIPPSKFKTAYKTDFIKSIKMQLFNHLMSTEQIIVIGYSAPESDFDHLSDIFVSKIMNPSIELKIINPENDTNDYRKRIQNIFHSISNVDFSHKDFKKWIGEYKVNP